MGEVAALVLAIVTQLGAGSHPITWLASVAMRRAAIAAPLVFAVGRKAPTPALPPPTAATIPLPKAPPRKP
ncbi:MAG: hypothetical protein HY908_07960 [Myxococcales bacterium]|nr:hypothetical protein [Myxococcales bacterium]